jgi:hypothetical protein
MSSPRRGVLAAGAIVCAAVAVLAVLWLTEQRTFVASVPQPPPLDETALVAVRGGESVCVREIAITPRSEVAQFRVGTRGRPAVPLTVVASGPGGYRSRTAVAPRWKDNDLVGVRVAPPPRALHGAFCVRNDGRRAIDVYAANDRSRTVVSTQVDGRDVDPNVQLTFLEAEASTIAARAGEVADELEAFRPAVVGPWLVWPLAVLVVAGIPLGLVWALWRAVGEDEGVTPPG